MARYPGELLAPGRASAIFPLRAKKRADYFVVSKFRRLKKYILFSLKTLENLNIKSELKNQITLVFDQSSTVHPVSESKGKGVA